MAIRDVLTRRLLPVAIVAIGGALVSTAVTAPAVATGGRTIAVVMTGAEEAPSAGDPDGIGLAVFKINPGQSMVCYALAVARLDGTVIAAHIHRAPRGVAGPIVVPLVPPVNGFSRACAQIDRALAVDIIRNRAGYYVNVHTSVFPPGAIRAQLDG